MQELWRKSCSSTRSPHLCCENSDAFDCSIVLLRNKKGEEWLKQLGVGHFDGEISGAESGDVVNGRKSLPPSVCYKQILTATAAFSPV